MQEPKANKNLKRKESSLLSVDKEDVKVTVKICQGCAITGYGKAGDIVEMPNSLALDYQRDGYVTILEKEIEDNGSL